MKADFSEAPQSVIHTAEMLIDKHHPWLKSARIAFVMREEAQKQGSRYILGQASKVPDKMKPHLEFDFLIWLSQEDYDRMTTDEREALIDHELCHCMMGNNGWTIRKHDIEEFAIVISRHGLWKDDLRQVERALEKWKQEILIAEQDVTMTISGAGKVATISGKQFSKLAKEMAAQPQ